MIAVDRELFFFCSGRGKCSERHQPHDSLEFLPTKNLSPPYALRHSGTYLFRVPFINLFRAFLFGHHGFRKHCYCFPAILASYNFLRHICLPVGLSKVLPILSLAFLHLGQRRSVCSGVSVSS